ncbi:MAG: TlpA family protein disulfide reductase [Flavisolibacter sp.]
MKTLYSLLLLLPAYHIIHAQERAQELTLHDLVPEIAFTHLYGAPATLKKLSDLKGKLVILDFWNIHCKGCLTAMKEVQSLQKEFGGKIQVILVTKDSKAQVDALFSKVKLPYPTLPLLTSDRWFNDHFPHVGEPFHVWINAEGTVEQITESYNTNEKAIAATLSGSHLNLATVKEWAGFDPQKSLWMQGEGRLLYHMKYYSCLMNRVTETLASSVSYFMDSAHALAGYRFINTTLLDLYKGAAFRQPPHAVPSSSVLLDVHNREPFTFPGDNSKIDDWYNANLYCYELCVPVNQRDRLYKIMLEDLNQLFPYKATVEWRRRRCLVLKRYSATSMLHSISGHAATCPGPDSICVINRPVSALVSQLAWLYRDAPTPIVDESGYKGNIDIRLHGDLKNPTVLNAALHCHGLQLIEDVHVIPMLVIRDK